MTCELDAARGIYGGINGTGGLITTLFLPRTAYQGQMDPTGNLSPLVFTSVSFAGVARSVDFMPLAFSAYVDDVTIGAAVPEPASMTLVLLGLATARRLRRARRPIASSSSRTPDCRTH
jgi:PEP-CTERM motif-containing protein